ncbi:MAG: flippase-like domain-containing protein, partial [Elusimicrobia bacterium]|nr:flippase-like domain-containing protein [Elusimicrobiota bacterium]
MKKLQWILMLVGGLTFLALLKKMNLQATWEATRLVGWGFLFIFIQEIVAYILNTLGWRQVFSPGSASHISFLRLLQLRIGGDGLNYLTPSVTLAGEWARTAMLGEDIPLSDRLSSVALAKITQGIAHGLMASLIVVWVLLHKISYAQIKNQIQSGAWLLGGLLMVVVILELRAWRMRKEEEPPTEEKSGWKTLRNLDHKIGTFIREYPARFVFSILFFFLSFLWGAFEAYWISHFLGVAVDIPTALCIETLSAAMDGLFIMVPAKLGTQEATKTAIF